MNDDCQIAAVQWHISIFALLNSEVIAPIFTKISHDVQALAQLLIAHLQNDVAFCFEMPEQKSEDGQF